MEIVFRRAVEADLPQVVALLASDVSSKVPTHLPSTTALEVFREIHADPNNEILVGTLGDRVVACLQATYIPCLSLSCAKRLLIEGVRVDSSLRGKGVGKKLFAYTLARGKEKGCQIAQLTTNNTRKEALAFYQALGFEASHQGLRLLI